MRMELAIPAVGQPLAVPRQSFSEHLQTVGGFRGARLLRRDDGGEVMFTSITWFASLDAGRGLPETITSRPSSRRSHGRPSAGGTSGSRTTK
jgi:hypothetical protein